MTRKKQIDTPEQMKKCLQCKLPECRQERCGIVKKRMLYAQRITVYGKTMQMIAWAARFNLTPGALAICAEKHELTIEEEIKRRLNK